MPSRWSLVRVLGLVAVAAPLLLVVLPVVLLMLLMVVLQAAVLKRGRVLRLLVYTTVVARI